MLTASAGELNRIRGNHVALVPQDASLALNPLLTVAEHMREVLARHTEFGRNEIRRKSLETLERVGLADPGRVLGARSSELSGGMKQRVGIALALLCDPDC